MNYSYRVIEVLRIVDGDTYDVVVSLGFGLRAAFRFRLEGLDTPEIFGVNKDSDEYAAGIAAKEFVEDWFDGRDVIARTFKGSGETIGLGDGAFGRWLAAFEDADTDEDLAESLRQYLTEEVL